MKKVFMSITLLLFCTLILSGCLRSYSFFYDFDSLMENLSRAEIIHMENNVVFFEIHWYVDVERINYESVRELTHYETETLIRGLSNVEFTYTWLWVPASVSSIYRMQGYAIKLYYESDTALSNEREPFIIIARTGDYRYGMRRLSQLRAGREATDIDWNALMSDLYFQRRLLPILRPIIFRIIAALFIPSGIVLLTGLGSFLLARTTKLKAKTEKYNIKTVSEFLGGILLSTGIIAFIFGRSVRYYRFWAFVILALLIFAIIHVKTSKFYRKKDTKHN